MAQGLSPYLTGNFPEDPTAAQNAPYLEMLMEQMGVKPKQVAAAVPQAPVEMPSLVAPPAAPVKPMPISQTVKIPAQIRPDMVSPQQLASAKSTQWEDTAKSALNEQDLGIGQLEQYINEFASKPRDLDLSPLAAYVDSIMPGSKLSSVKPPMSEDERQKIFMELQDKLQQRKAALTQSSLAPYKAQLDAYKDVMRLSAQDSGRQGRFEASQEVKLFDKARKEQAGLTKDAADFANSYKNVENAITPDADGTVSVGRVNQSLSQFARLMGEKGVLTDTDTGRQLAPTLDRYMTNMRAILESNPNARMPAKNVEAMQEALKVAQAAFKQSYDIKAKSFENTYFNNPGSPYSGREWAPGLVGEIYKPLELIDKPAVPATAPPAPERKTWNGKTFEKKNGTWVEVE